MRKTQATTPAASGARGRAQGSGAVLGSAEVRSAEGQCPMNERLAHVLRLPQPSSAIARVQLVQSAPTVPGEKPAGRSQESPVCGGERWVRDLPTQHRQLMSKDDDSRTPRNRSE